MTSKGLHWIIISTSQQPILRDIATASRLLSNRKRELSNYRLAATTGLLLLALAIVVRIGWKFSRPIDELARAARRVAEGSLDFRVNIRRPDEVGQLAATFNEMISGLKIKSELEEKLNQSERAAVIGRLTQSVAHEVRNPLNVINLSIDHVSSKYAPEDERKREQFTGILSSIKDEIARLKYLVNDLLNYGRPSQMAFRPLDVRELVSETMTLVRSQADAQGVTLRVEDDDCDAEVMGDRERLKSCLSNIVINALQAMPQGGELSTELKRADGWIKITIKDTGIGISEEAIQKIFEPYFSTRVSGFGLGLAVTKSIIEDHRGTIKVRSRLGHGTTFTVKLPVSSEVLMKMNEKQVAHSGSMKI
jgi:signal transduction histidine kinase